jgi:integrase
LADGRRVSLGVHDSAVEANGVLAAAIQISEQSATPAASGTGAVFSAVAARWLRDLEASGYAAIATMKSIAKVWLPRIEFYDWPVQVIRPRDVRRLRKWLRKQSLSDSYRRQVFTAVRSSLAAAVEDELIEQNPCDGVTAPEREARTDDPWTYLTGPEQQALFALPAETFPLDWRCAVEFAVLTGLRAGEQWNLRLADVHIDGEDPHIVVRFGRRQRGRSGPTKGRRIRRVPLLPRAMELLRVWLRELTLFCPRNSYGLVFPGELGGYRKVSRVPGWSKWLEAAGIKRRVRWHDLRHTCAASLISGLWGHSWRLEAVRDFLGHAEIRETERYAHLADTVLKQSARATVQSQPTPGPRSPISALVFETCASNGVSDGGCRLPEQSREFITQRGLRVDQETVAAGLRLARLARDGEDCSAALLDFVGRVIDSPEQRLARAALAGGPHALTRALELVEMLCADTPAGAQQAGVLA